MVKGNSRRVQVLLVTPLNLGFNLVSMRRGIATVLRSRPRMAYFFESLYHLYASALLLTFKEYKAIYNDIFFLLLNIVRIS